MILKGIRFGMLLQLAVGPLCLMVFNTSSSYGFIMAMVLVMSIVLVDSLYIVLAGFGISAIINKDSVKQVFKLFGCIVLAFFGINIITSSLGFSLLPQLSFLSDMSNKKIFIQGLVLTASNPLTIIFWSGVFTTQIVDNQYNKKQLILFGTGCALSTLIFLSLIAFLGTVFSGFLPENIIKILNIIVGVFLVIFGIRLLLKKDKK